MSLALLLVALLAPATPVQSRTVVMAPIEAPRLSPELAGILPGLMAAAIESGGRYQVLPPRAPQPGEAASRGAWQLEVRVSGKGPWRLEARASQDHEGRAADRIKVKKQPFRSREELTAAVDAVAAALESEMAAADPPVEGAGGTVPLARELSGSDEAVDAYLQALSALRGGEASRALPLLDRALARDPGFALAAAEKTWTLWTTDPLFPSVPAPVSGSAPPAGAGDPAAVLLSAVARGMEQLRAGDAPHAIQVGESLRQRSPVVKWGRVLRGLSLAAMGRLSESEDDWETVVAVDPADPRGGLWLAAARMAAGDFTQAADGFSAVRAEWPELLRVYVLEAEAHARGRDTDGARQVLQDMKRWMSAHDITPHSDDTNPDLMLGALELLEGHYDGAQRMFGEALQADEEQHLPPAVTNTLHLSVLALKRDSVASSDPLKRQREFEDNYAALEEWEASLSPAEREAQRTRFLRLRGMIQLKEGNTVEAWKTVQAIRALSDSEGYSEFDDAVLTAATMLKEGDAAGCVKELARAARASDRTVDLIYLGQMQLRTGQREEARATFDQAEERLMHYRPAPQGGPEDLILTDPHLAARVPIFLYSRATLAYETGRSQESRYYFSRLLKYYRTPDDRVKALAQEAAERGAKPE